MEPPVTVVCSAWHKQKSLDQFFTQHVQSLLGQTIPVRAIYVCDGGSQLPKVDARVEIVSTTKPISTAEAFMMALAITDTEYFAALNIDDFYFRDGLAIQVALATENKLDMICGDWEIRFEELGDIAQRTCDLHMLRPCRNWPPEVEKGLRLGSGDGRRGTYGPAPVFRTAAVREVGGYPRHFGDGTAIRTIIDYVLWDRLAKAGKKMARAGVVVGSYYSNAAGQQEFRSGGNDGVMGEHEAYRRHGARL